MEHLLILSFVKEGLTSLFHKDVVLQWEPSSSMSINPLGFPCSPVSLLSEWQAVFYIPHAFLSDILHALFFDMVLHFH